MKQIKSRSSETPSLSVRIPTDRAASGLIQIGRSQATSQSLTKATQK